jgi:beta-xylosidase
VIKTILFVLPLAAAVNLTAYPQSPDDTSAFSGNPLFPGWYADPEATIFGNEYWIYPTYSGETGDLDSVVVLSDKQRQLQKNTINQQYLKQTFFDAFSSRDLTNWQKHPHVLELSNVSWGAYSLWAPSIVKKGKKYYLFFGANDIQSNDQEGGIGVAVSDHPAGPFKDALGKPLINKFHNGAQPIDQFVFRDPSGKYYMYYGGWKHCNVAQLSDDLLSIKPFADGTKFKEVTPEGYVEGSFMFVRNGKYYFMWSEGGWTGPDYSVAYAISSSPTGPFKRIGKILQQDSTVATGAGHHSVIRYPGTDDWYIVYHRRPLGDRNGNHRQTCIERMYFDESGHIMPVRISFQGVPKRSLKP